MASFEQENKAFILCLWIVINFIKTLDIHVDEIHDTHGDKAKYKFTTLYYLSFLKWCVIFTVKMRIKKTQKNKKQFLLTAFTNNTTNNFTNWLIKLKNMKKNKHQSRPHKRCRQKAKKYRNSFMIYHEIKYYKSYFLHQHSTSNFFPKRSLSLTHGFICYISQNCILLILEINYQKGIIV